MSTTIDVETLKASLKTFMKAQKSFEDYDFEGSNLAALIDLLAYNSHLLAQYQNMVGSEMFLDTASLRESIVSHSKELNYVPGSKTSSRINLTVSVAPDDAPDFVTIPKHYKVYTTLDNVTYTFTCPETVVVKNNNGSYVSEEITFYEGEIVKEVFSPTVSYDDEGRILPYTYQLTSSNVDTSSIEVNVRESNTSTSNSNWTVSSSLFGVLPTSNIFFVEGFRANNYQVAFGNDVLGRALKNGNIVTITYRDTVGKIADGVSSFSKSLSIDGYTDVSISANGYSYGGSDREANAKIKYNAPRYFQTQERAVTAQDFIVLTQTQFPELESVIAYGGEEESPPQYGKVIVSVKPAGVVGNITESLKKQITEYLKLKSITTEPIIKDPVFFYIEVVSTVYWDSKLTTKSATTLKSEVIAKIQAYNTTSLSDFGSDVRYSKLINSIDSVSDAIVSNDTSIRISYRWSPLTNTETKQSVIIDFQQALNNTTDSPAVESSLFSYTTGGTSYTNCYFEDDGAGTIRIVRVVDGVKNVLNSSSGTVDYNTGEVTISSIFSGYDGTHIKINGMIATKDILSSKNVFLIIDSEDITVTLEKYLD